MLSDEQAAVVHHDETRHAQVLAVAGSGKSFTVVERNAYLIEAIRTPPNRIIGVMFGEGAAKELAQRNIKRLGRANAPEAVTFHNLGTKTLRTLIKQGLAPDWEFTASPARATSFAAKIIESTCRRNGFNFPRMVAEVFLSFVDRVKGDLLSPAEVWKNGEWDDKYSWFVEMFNHYESVRQNTGVRFFSDLIYDPVKIMMENPAAAAAIANRYQHIVLDEYQDICESQQALIRLTAGTETRVMSVGDDDQTIYTWRGAKPSYILGDFERDFPGGVTYHLTKTRRYGPALSCAANYVITHNTVRADKLCISHESTHDTQIAIEYEGGEGKTLLKIISDFVAKGRKLSEIAILLRTYSKSNASQFALLQAGIPFRLEGGDNASVLDNRWVACLIGWMQVAAGLFASRPYAGDPDIGAILQAKSILNVPSLGLSWEGINSLAKCVLQMPDDMQGFMHFVITGLNKQDGFLSERILQRGKLWKKVRDFSRQRGQVDALTMVSMLIEALQIKEHIAKESRSEDQAEEQWLLVDAFVNYVKVHSQDTLGDFLRHIQDLKTFSDRAKTATDAVNMLSVHRSKGLEYPCVIMIGLNQGGFPHQPRKKQSCAIKEAMRIEDERRLFYVAMTRAREYLWMLCPPDNQLNLWHRAGKTGSPEDLMNHAGVASQFLYETNLYLSRSMPVMLKKDIVGLKAANPEVYNAYLREAGVPRSVEKLG